MLLIEVKDATPNLPREPATLLLLHTFNSLSKWFPAPDWERFPGFEYLDILYKIQAPRFFFKSKNNLYTLSLSKCTCNYFTFMLPLQKKNTVRSKIFNYSKILVTFLKHSI